MGFQREQLPDPVSYFESVGLTLRGRGKWRTTRCDFHDGSDSMRVNTDSGAWVCMACGVKGGDVLGYHMKRAGQDFVQAARALGAWSDDGKPAPPPRPFSARDALSCIAVELNVCMVVISDARRGTTPNDADWERFLRASDRIERIALESLR